MKVLITGGAGFIGSHLVDSLLKDKRIKKITIIDNLLDGNLKNLKSSLGQEKVFFYKRNFIIVIPKISYNF